MVAFKYSNRCFNGLVGPVSVLSLNVVVGVVARWGCIDKVASRLPHLYDCS